MLPILVQKGFKTAEIFNKIWILEPQNQRPNSWKTNVGQKLPYLMALILPNVQLQKNMKNISSSETWVLLIKGNQKILTITNLIFTVNRSLKKRGQVVLTQWYRQLFIPKFFLREQFTVKIRLVMVSKVCLQTNVPL